MLHIILHNEEWRNAKMYKMLLVVL